MRISIITATYNSAATLRDTIRSVLAQTYKDIEYIVVDGMSSDGTLDIIKEYEPLFAGRLRYISEPDSGLYDAMNKGINMATGDVVGILNSDDFYYNDKVLEGIANAFNESPIDSVYGNLVFVDAKNTNKIVRQWKGSQYSHRAFLRGWHPAHPTFYARKICFQKYGGFDLSFAISADFELMLRFIEKEQIRNKYINMYFVRMRMGGASTGSIKNIIRGNQNILRAFRKNGFKVSPLYFSLRFFPKIWGLLKIRLNPHRLKDVHNH